jgi:hypothetical protein
MPKNVSEGIVVYCTKGNVIFSSTGEIVQNTKNVRKHKVNRSIIFPEFEEMKKFEKLEYWINMLSRFSKNIFPRDFKYLGHVLYYKAKTKKHRSECFVDLENLEESYSVFKDFMKEKGFLSQEEKEKINSMIQEEEEIHEMFVVETWKDITKNLEYHLKTFFIKLKDENDLTPKEMANLESVVRIGISSGFFSEDNIVIQNSEIDRILNLVWDEEERLFSIDTEGIKFKKKSEKKESNKIYTSYTIETSNDNVIMVYKEVEDLSIEKKWNKFLETVYKNDDDSMAM